MATQFKHIDFTSTSALTPRPNIRVAFIAGKAATAVHDTMAKLPAETRDATLDELTAAASADVELIQNMTCSLIETAHNLLSPAMYNAFLRWGETASHASSFYESDDEGGVRCATAAEARTLVGDTPAENVHDLLFATLLTCIETADAPAFGPFDRSYGDFDVNGGDLLAGLSRDLRKFSPIPDLVNELSARAWNASKSRLAISLEIGAAVTRAFSFARGEDATEREGGSTVVNMDGYNPFMRGPLIQWQRAYDRFVDAQAEADRFHANVITPADARFMSVRRKWPTNYDFSADRAAWLELDAVDYTHEEERYAELCAAANEAKERLYLTPAPGPGELAIKLQLFTENEDRQLNLADRILRQMTHDARRFGRHGAFLRTDAAMLEAFATRRREFETADKGPWTAEQEDAYFGRVDASEMVLLNTRATTIEGVLAKLRVAFMNQVGTNWSDLAISNTADPKFVEGLRMSDLYARLAWGAIEDLARIGGVNLAEQGA